MDITIESAKQNLPALKVGDIIDAGGDIYILMRNTGGEFEKRDLVAFRSFDGECLANSFQTLEVMQRWVKERGYNIYSKYEYELVLNKK